MYNGLFELKSSTTQIKCSYDVMTLVVLGLRCAVWIESCNAHTETFQWQYCRYIYTVYVNSYCDIVDVAIYDIVELDLLWFDDIDDDWLCRLYAD